jgi:hypothetical protein
MMNSTDCNQPQILVEEVCKLISAGTIYRLIDEPILLATERFDSDLAGPFSCVAFLKVIGEFVGHLYVNGLGAARRLSSSHARAEAVAIMEESYQGPDESGYDAALLDATYPNRPGIEWVLWQITEAIILRHRSQHIKWVFETHINSLSWASKCHVAEFLVTQNVSLLPESLLNCHPAQIAHKLDELIKILVEADEKKNGMGSSYITP